MQYELLVEKDPREHQRGRIELPETPAPDTQTDENKGKENDRATERINQAGSVRVRSSA